MHSACQYTGIGSNGLERRAELEHEMKKALRRAQEAEKMLAAARAENEALLEEQG